MKSNREEISVNDFDKLVLFDVNKVLIVLLVAGCTSSEFAGRSSDGGGVGDPLDASDEGFALDFSGTNRPHVWLGDSPVLDVTQGSFTVELWYRGGQEMGEFRLFDQGCMACVLSSWTLSLIEEDRASKIAFRRRDEGDITVGGNVISLSASLNDQQWHHIAFVFDGQDGHVFVDGNHVAEESIGFSPRNLTEGTYVGPTPTTNRQTSGGGLIRGVRLWNVARSTEEIENQRDARLPTGVGLVGNWPMDEGQGQVVHDRSMNSLDGALGSDRTAADQHDPVWVPRD